jgi:hypothetical protein
LIEFANGALSTTQRDGRRKAAFFGSFGFRADQWQALEVALVGMHDVAKEENSQFGTRYVVAGRMIMAEGSLPWLEPLVRRCRNRHATIRYRIPIASVK